MTANGNIWSSAASARVYDLGQPLQASMPVSPNHPGFRMALLRRHGDVVRADGSSASNEMMVMGGHSGTHIDALCHVSYQGQLHGGHDAFEAQRGGAFSVHGAENIPIFFCRGVMLDIPRLLGTEVLEPGTPITAEMLSEAAKQQEVEIGNGDAVLIRSGWPRHWNDTVRFVGLTDGAPGLDESGARWLIERSVCLAGGETIAFECIPPGRGHALLPVHRMLLVEHGIHIVEVMNLSQLAEKAIHEFLFVLSPLKVVGATGVPVRPIAVV
jgi:kynurenine formamidase